MPPILARVAPFVLAVSLTACGSSGTPKATPSQTPSPTATPTLPPVADDAAKVKAALVTAADLGKPWVQPKSVSQVKHAKGELCPGQKSAAALNKARADETRRLTEGTKAGVPIGSFTVRAYAYGTEQAWRDAYATSAGGCATWTSLEKQYVTLEVVASPPTVAGADEVLAHIERVYAEASHKTLYYVRHYYEARTGRVVSAFEYAYVQPRSDPTGKDMTTSAAILEKQVAKTRTTFEL